jgi:hypothetical protein
VLAELVKPAIDDDRNRSVVEEVFVAPDFQFDSTPSRSIACRVDAARPMETLIFFTAIGFSETRVSGQDEKRARTIAGNSIRCDLGGLESFARQTLDRITADCVEHAQQHRPAFIGGARIAWPEVAP